MPLHNSTGNAAFLINDVVNGSASVEAEDLEHSLYQWISKERFVVFPKVSGVGLNEMTALGKLLAIFVFDDNDSATVEKTR